MQLVTRALSAAAEHRMQQAKQRDEWLRSEILEIESLVEQMFGLPFSEAFDRERTRYTDTGYAAYAIVDDYIFLATDEDGLRVTVWRRDGGPTERYVGDEVFERGGPEHHDENLVRLGLLLLRAHTTTREAA